MVSSDDHKREVMIDMYSHLTDREHFEEQVVHHFSLSDTMRSRTLEMLQEKLAERSKDHTKTGVLPTVAAAQEAPPVNSTTSTSKADDVQTDQAAQDGGQDRTEEVAPGSTAWCFCCTGATNADDSKEQLVEQAEERAVDEEEALESNVNIEYEQEDEVVAEDGEGEAPQKIGAES